MYVFQPASRLTCAIVLGRTTENTWEASRNCGRKPWRLRWVKFDVHPKGAFKNKTVIRHTVFACLVYTQLIVCVEEQEKAASPCYVVLFLSSSGCAAKCGSKQPWATIKSPDFPYQTFFMRDQPIETVELLTSCLKKNVDAVSLLAHLAIQSPHTPIEDQDPHQLNQAHDPLRICTAPMQCHENPTPDVHKDGQVYEIGVLA